MTRRRPFTAALALFLAACAADSGPPLEVTGVRLIAPLPGADSGVGYMTITNRSREPLILRSFSSPQFARVELHESFVVDGVARMREAGVRHVEPGASVALEPYGLHLMLLDPAPGVVPGTATTLEITHDAGLLIISATLEERRSGI